MKSQGQHLTAFCRSQRLIWFVGSTLLLLAASSSQVSAQTVIVDENFKNSILNPGNTNWSFGIGNAVSDPPCLTAALLQASPPTSGSGFIPGCPTTTTNAPAGATNGTIYDSPGNGALRLTPAKNDQAGFVLYNQLLPSNQGLVVSFEFYSYGGEVGADGISLFLLDGSQPIPTQAGAFGGSLGYGTNTTGANAGPGIAGGYVGVGIDEFGNYSNNSEGRVGGKFSGNVQVPDSVALRGNQASSYEYLTGTNDLGDIDFAATFITDRNAAGGIIKRTARITLTPDNKISVEIDFGAGYQLVIPLYDLSNNVTADSRNDPVNQILPPTLRFGFASSTGTFTNIHEIQSLRIDTLVPPVADLSITKTDNLDTANPGDTITYTIVATNNGPAGVFGASVTDTIPSQLENATWTCTAKPGSRCIAPTGSGNINTTINLLPNGAATFTVTAQVKAGATGSIENTASVALPPNSGLTDPTPGNNSATDATSLPAITPDLAIEKTHTGNFIVGKQGVYTLSVRNLPTNGPTTGTVTITDTLPTGFSFVSATGTNWSCSASGQVVTCTYTGGVVAPGENLPAIALKVNVSSAAVGNITNTASVTTPGDDPNNPHQGKNTALDNTTVIFGPVAHKSVRFLRDNDNTGTLTVGDDIQYKIIVQNLSSNPTPFTELVISDVIPTQLQVLRDGGANPVTVDSGFVISPNLPSTSFNGTGSSVTFTQPGTLAPAATVTLTFNARILPNGGSPIANQGSVSYAEDSGTPVLTDASDSNNPSLPGSGVNPGVPITPEAGGNVSQPNDSNADPTIINFVTPINPSGTKSVRLAVDADGSGSLSTGDILEYTITYTNSDPSSLVSDFVVTDAISSGQSFVNGSYKFTAINGSGTTNNSTTVTANPSYNGTTDTNLTNPTTKGVLGARGGKVVINFRAVVTAGVGVTITNQASATASGANVTSPSFTDTVSGPGDLPQGNGNGNNDPTQLIVTASGPARLRLVKRITTVNRTEYSNYVPSDPSDANEAAFPGVSQFLLGVPKLGSETPLRSGDEVEYTIYFLSDGGSPVQKATFCDLIPEGTTFVPNSIETSATVLKSSFFSPLAPLPLGNACANPNNPNGAITMNLGTVPNTAPSNVGFIRFRVKIN